MYIIHIIVICKFRILYCFTVLCCLIDTGHWAVMFLHGVRAPEQGYVILLLHRQNLLTWYQFDITPTISISI